MHPDSFTGGGANDNLALSIIRDGTQVGLSLGIDDSGATKTVRVTARSQNETRQGRSGTSNVATGAWARIGGVVNIAGDTITPYLNGAAENGGAVTFGASSWTFGTPSIQDTIGCYDVPPSPSTAVQWDGRIAEVAIWTSDIGADGFAQLERVSPRLISPATLVFHMRLSGRGTTEVDGVAGVTGTVTGSLPAAADPLIIQPAGPIYARAGAAASATAFAVRLEMEFSGRGNGWTDISADLTDDPIKLRYGINGNKPRDRVASSGTLDFSLNNSVTNSAGLAGYYSPNHVSKRTNFKLGNRVRLAVTTGGATFYKFVGRLDVIAPTAGLYGDQVVGCQAVDWMDEAARAKVTGLAVQFNKRSDELFSTLVAAMASPPNAIEIVQPGNDTYELAFDTAEDEKVSVMTEFQKIATSELGQIYVKGDTVQGGTLVFEGRGKRGTARTNVARFTDVSGLVALQIGQSRADIINKFQVINHPKIVDAAPTTILYDLEARVPVGANSTLSLLGPYRDPSLKASRVGGTNMQAPVATTDYTMNTLADGTGSDLTASFSVVANYGGSGVRYTITNNGSVSGYITKLQARGKGVYSYQTVVLEGHDEDSQVNYGENADSLDQPYQSNPAVGWEIAIYLAQLYRDPSTQVQRAEIFAAATEESVIRTLMAREVSDRIGLSETLSGLTDDGPGETQIGYFINQIEIEIDALNNFRVAYLVAPSDKTAYWLLEVPGAGELDTNTVLGFGQIVGHTDVAHLDSHGDSAHADVAHADSHTDTAHLDAAHSDSGHSDVAHSDVAHVDTHSDVAHLDDAHQDVAHVDSHSDVTHSDVAHEDVAHQDTAHDDVFGEFGEHFDSPHADQGHGDAHTDVAHGDGHGDTIHQDEAHEDAAHADAHSDGAHADTAHADAAHGDASHSDSAHEDVAHADTNHSDVAHGDTHTDVAHGDI